MVNLYKDLLFVYLQPTVNKNSLNLAIWTLLFDDVTVKTIYSIEKFSTGVTVKVDNQQRNCLVRCLDQMAGLR